MWLTTTSMLPKILSTYQQFNSRDCSIFQGLHELRFKTLFHPCCTLSCCALRREFSSRRPTHQADGIVQFHLNIREQNSKPNEPKTGKWNPSYLKTLKVYFTCGHCTYEIRDVRNSQSFHRTVPVHQHATPNPTASEVKNMRHVVNASPCFSKHETLLKWCRQNALHPGSTFTKP